MRLGSFRIPALFASKRVCGSNCIFSQWRLVDCARQHDRDDSSYDWGLRSSMLDRDSVSGVLGCRDYV